MKSNYSNKLTIQNNEFIYLLITSSIIPLKKINIDKLCNLLLDLDSDEGIRIENSEHGKKIYVNRNILGTYAILIRTKMKIDDKVKEGDHNSSFLVERYVEKIHYFDHSALVLEFIKQNMDKPIIWLY